MCSTTRAAAIEGRGARGRSHLVSQALEEGGLQLRHEGLQTGAGLANEQAQRVQDGGLHLPGKAIPNDADERACTHAQKIGDDLGRPADRQGW